MDASDEPLVFVFTPSLAAVLIAAEREKGAPLTEDEVVGVRDNATCVALPVSVAREVTDKRGYEDIDPENVWQAWLAVRTSG